MAIKRNLYNVSWHHAWQETELQVSPLHNQYHVPQNRIKIPSIVKSLKDCFLEQVCQLLCYPFFSTFQHLGICPPTCTSVLIHGWVCSFLSHPKVTSPGHCAYWLGVVVVVSVFGISECVQQAQLPKTACTNQFQPMANASALSVVLSVG